MYEPYIFVRWVKFWANQQRNKPVVEVDVQVIKPGVWMRWQRATKSSTATQEPYTRILRCKENNMETVLRQIFCMVLL